MKPHKVFQVFQDWNRLYTKNLVPGHTPFDEKEVKGFREFNPKRSKLAAAIQLGAANVGIREGDVVLYLGCSHGYTPSFVSDMIGGKGFLFGVDLAPRVMRDFVFLCEERLNMAPILEDAFHVDKLAERICQVDVIYQDLAQKNQTEIFLKNVDRFLKKGGYALLAVKARSIDVTKSPKQIFEQVRKEVDKHLKVIDYKIISKFQKDHAFIICKK